MHGRFVFRNQHDLICPKGWSPFRVQVYNRGGLKSNPGKKSTKRRHLLGLRCTLFPRIRIAPERQAGL